jgi:ferrous iron transport protein A
MQIEETDSKAPFPLAMAQEGDQVKVFLLRGGKGLEMRLTSLGLNVGSELTVSQRQGGNLVVIRGETRLALGTGMAHKIMVVRQQIG